MAVTRYSVSSVLYLNRCHGAQTHAKQEEQRVSWGILLSFHMVRAVHSALLTYVEEPNAAGQGVARVCCNYQLGFVRVQERQVPHVESVAHKNDAHR